MSTTTPQQQKAIEFLDKNYTRLKDGDKLKLTFYMLKSDSINGIAEYSLSNLDDIDYKKDKAGKAYIDSIVEPNVNGFMVRMSYTSYKPDKKTGKPTVINTIDEKIIYPTSQNVNDIVWYRNSIMPLMGPTARNVILGGKTSKSMKRRVKRTKTKRSRVSARHTQRSFSHSN